MEQLEQLAGVLLAWYEAGHRELPWRHTREPYPVWLSEIMLQQTRVEAVRGYYARFLEALPTVFHLARCDDDRLHKLWEGLGYYSRVRNLKKAAQVITQQYGGVFPRNYEQIRALPGIGDYTAGAICSICFDLPTPAVDGNVLRLMSRLRNDNTPIDLPARKAEVRQALAAVYPSQAGLFTQALMELGATLCGPNRPAQCDICPCRGFCLAHRHGTAATLPVKSPKKQRRQEDITLLLMCCGDRYALQKRPKQGLLAGLWEFPNIPGRLDAAAGAALARQWDTKPRDILRILEKSHIFTHIQWNMTGIYLEVEQLSPRFQWLTEAQIQDDSALPTAFRQFWEDRHV